MQNRLVDFNISEYQMFANMVPDSTMQLNSKKLPYLEFWCSSKEKCLHLSENSAKMFHPSPTAEFPSSTLTKQHIIADWM